MTYDCEDCIRRLDQMVDRELSAPEVREVQEHFARCGDCTQRYEFHAELKRLVRVSCDEKAPAELRRRLENLFR
jgi:mycothiol system anti-sigma-R factor